MPLIEPGSKFSKKNYESQQTSSQSLQKVTVELNDLDWADRETVLRLLFSKMNTGEPANNWRDDDTSSRNPSQATGGSKSAALNQGFREENEAEMEDDYYGEKEDYAYED